MDAEDTEFSEKKLFQLFAAVDATKKKAPKESEYYDSVNSEISFSSQLSYSSNTHLNSKITKYKKFKKQKFSTSQIIEKASHDIVLSIPAATNSQSVPDATNIIVDIQVNDQTVTDDSLEECLVSPGPSTAVEDDKRPAKRGHKEFYNFLLTII